MSNLYVFLGPTLSSADVLAMVPAARVLPPVRHGDLLRLPASRGDTVLIVDGVFHQSVPVRHKEILHLLDRGVRVIGASSMGALRAAELHPYGMIGIGRVFAMYREGTITADDEVAVAHADDGDFRAVGDPLVNIRYGAEQAVHAGILTLTEAAHVLDSAREIPFTSRSWRLAVRRAESLRPDTGERLLTWVAAHRRELDLKRLDALAALAHVRSANPSEEGTAGKDATAVIPSPLREPGRPQLWRTDRLRGWTLRYDARDVRGRQVPASAEIHYAQLTDPEFPARWYAACIRRMAGFPIGSAACASLAHDPAGLAEAENHVLVLAADRGLTVATLPPSHVRMFLSDAESTEWSATTALLRLLVRLSGASPGLLPGDDEPGATDHWVGMLVADREATRNAVAAAFEANTAMTAANPRRRVHNIRTEALHRDLCTLWEVTPDDPLALLRAARDRGFASPSAAAEVFRYFAVALRTSAQASTPVPVLVNHSRGQ